MVYLVCSCSCLVCCDAYLTMIVYSWNIPRLQTFDNNCYLDQCIQIRVNDKDKSMIDVGFIIAKVKVYTKKYKTSNGTNKETKTKTINLGANAPFNDGDAVYVINQTDYNDIINNQDQNKEIETLTEQLDKIQRNFNELDKQYQERFQEIQGIKEDNKKLREKLFKSEERKEELHNALHDAQGRINEKDKIITAYEMMGFWKRIRHYNPKQDIEMIETSTKNE